MEGEGVHLIRGRGSMSVCMRLSAFNHIHLFTFIFHSVTAANTRFCTIGARSFDTYWYTNRRRISRRSHSNRFKLIREHVLHVQSEYETGQRIPNTF